MLPIELWDQFDQPTREWMANRYFKTTRACLSLKQILHICIEECKALESKLYEGKEFLLPKVMKEDFGFDCIKINPPYFEYVNDGTRHRNKHYNPLYPESRGKVLVSCNMDYSEESAFIQIEQDGGTRTVYHGICQTAEFLEVLLNSVR